MTNRVFSYHPYGELGCIELFERLVPLLNKDMTVLDLGIGNGLAISPVAFDVAVAKASNLLINELLFFIIVIDLIL